jgi:hypothetical protein
VKVRCSLQTLFAASGGHAGIRLLNLGAVAARRLLGTSTLLAIMHFAVIATEARIPFPAFFTKTAQGGIDLSVGEAGTDRTGNECSGQAKNESGFHV